MVYKDLTSPTRLWVSIVQFVGDEGNNVIDISCPDSNIRLVRHAIS